MPAPVLPPNFPQPPPKPIPAVDDPAYPWYQYAKALEDAILIELKGEIEE